MIDSLAAPHLHTPLRVLMVTTEWPTPARPCDVPFIVRQVAFLRRAGVDVDVFFFRGGQRPGNYLRAWRQVWQRRAHTPYDLVHAQWGQNGLLGLPKTLPLVVTFRGDDVKGIIGQNGRSTLAGHALQLASKFAALMADEAIAVSESLAQHLPRHDVHIIPSGLDLEQFRPLPRAEARQQLGLPADQRLVLFAADPANPRKRFWLAQAACEQLQQELETQLVVAYGVPHDSMPLYMNACDVLLLPSLHEGSPNVVKEALACNMPVIATDAGDVRARIADLPDCAVVPDSPQALVAALAATLRQPRRIDVRRHVLALDERRLTEQTIAVYRKALTKKGRQMADDPRNSAA